MTRPAILRLRTPAGDAATLPVVAASLLLAGSLWVGGCADVPPVDAPALAREHRDEQRTRPDIPQSAEERLTSEQVAQWVRDLDSADRRVHVEAKAGLVESLEHGLRQVYDASLPSTTHGQTAFIEILARAPLNPAEHPDEQQRWDSMVNALREIIARQTEGGRPESEQHIALRLLALATLSDLAAAHPDAPTRVVSTAVGRLRDDKRQVRWRAADAVRRHAAHLHQRDLTAMLDLLDHPEAQIRTDTGRLVLDLYRLLTPASTRQQLENAGGPNNPGRPMFNPVAAEATRQRQVQQLRTWAEGAEAYIASYRARHAQ